MKTKTNKNQTLPKVEKIKRNFKQQDLNLEDIRKFKANNNKNINKKTNINKCNTI